jgi:PIN domain nuclease of toxin-antitoxin system
MDASRTAKSRSRCLLWALYDPDRLSARAVERITKGDELGVSVASLWEITIKHSLGKLRFPVSLKDFLEWRVYQSSLVVIGIDSAILITLGAMAWTHEDPFDRLIIATGQAQDLPIVTADRRFVEYPIECVW